MFRSPLITICSLLGLVMIVVIPTLIGYSVFRPISGQIRQGDRRTQFMLTDFIWLVFQLQIALAVGSAVPRESRYSFSLILGYLSFATIAAWWGAVTTLMRAGVQQPFRRAVFILFLLPSVLLLMVGATVAVLVCAFLGVELSVEGWLREDNDAVLMGIVWTCGLLPVALLTVGACRLLRKLAVWIVQLPPIPGIVEPTAG